jgi:hypothetical protein
MDTNKAKQVLKNFIRYRWNIKIDYPKWNITFGRLYTKRTMLRFILRKTSVFNIDFLEHDPNNGWATYKYILKNYNVEDLFFMFDVYCIAPLEFEEKILSYEVMQLK